jgi:VanZ family protein
MFQKANQTMAWVMMSAIVFLTVVPPSLRPTTPVPHKMEHAVIFFVNAMAFGFGYPRRELLLGVGAVVFCAVVEISQLFVSGRHARPSDFVVDTIAALAGVYASAVVIRSRYIVR